MGLIKGRMICPNCGADTTFLTSAHVAQEWVVDPKGNFVSCFNDCSEVTADPDPDNIWTCRKCGSEGVYRDDL